MKHFDAHEFVAYLALTVWGLALGAYLVAVFA